MSSNRELTQKEIEKAKQIEQYLAEVEQRAITDVCPENQLKARLANTLEPLRSYELLSKVKGLEVVGSTVRMHLRAECELSQYEKDVVLSQVQSIYSIPELDIESVEYVVEKGYKPTSVKSEVGTKETAIMPTLKQDIWGEVSKQLIETYGVHVYNNWFSKLTPVINENARTVELKTQNSFVKQWVKNYWDTIQETSKKLRI